MALPLAGVVAAWLVMESVEGLGARANGLSRGELMELVRWVMREGLAAVQAAERTECFERVAWGSVEARAGRRPTTTRDLRYYVRKMLKVEGVAQLPLRAMTTAQCRMCAATPLRATTLRISGICRSCRWRSATAIDRSCSAVTWPPPQGSKAFLGKARKMNSMSRRSIRAIARYGDG